MPTTELQLTGIFGPSHSFSPKEAVPVAVTISIEGRCLTGVSHGVDADSTRTVIAMLTSGDAAIEYVFEETEVS